MSWTPEDDTVERLKTVRLAAFRAFLELRHLLESDDAVLDSRERAQLQHELNSLDCVLDTLDRLTGHPDHL